MDDVAELSSPTADRSGARGALRVVVANAASMLASDVVNRATTFVLYALVARHLGAYEFGQLSLALTLFYTFQILAVAGLKTLVTREVAKRRDQTDRYLVNASLVVLGTSLLSIVAAVVFVWAMGYESDTAAIVLLLSAGLVPYALAAVSEAVFQGWERMRLIAIANVPANAAKIVLAFALLSLGGGLRQIVLLLVASQLIVMVLDWTLLLRYVTRPRASFDARFAAHLLRATTTFLGIDGIIAVTGSLNVILLSRLYTENDVGYYNAGTQMLVPVTLVFQSIVLSVFPIMCRRFDSSQESLRRIAERVIELMLAIALPMAVGLFFLSHTITRLLYGDRGLDRASVTLSILSWGLVLTALTSILGQVLVASLREKVTLRIVAIDLVVSVVAGALLIGQFADVGAALTGLLIRAVDTVLHYLPVAGLFPLALMARVVWKPAVASGVMALVFLAVGRQGAFLSALAASLVYLAVLLALTVWSAGGPRQLRVRYQYLWPE